MKTLLFELADAVREKVRSFGDGRERRALRDDSGDPHFEVDELAEATVVEHLERWPVPVALFSEDRGLLELHPHPEWILIVDPIDGTRPAMAGFESACFSVAVAPYSKCPRFGDIEEALVMELKSGEAFHADADGWSATGPGLPALGRRTDVRAMTWSLELTAHPVRRLVQVYGELIDGSVTRGGVFVFTSSSYSLTRIITGQLDAHVDIGHGILRRRPDTLPEFLQTGRGKVVTLFSYDIAGAAYLLQRAGGVVTDAFGESLKDLPLLTDKGVDGQCSLIAAANPSLHQNILSQLRWDALELTE